MLPFLAHAFLFKCHVYSSRFPSSQTQKEMWKTLTGISVVHPASSGVCIKHFKQEDMYLTNQRKRLTSSAVPSLHVSEDVNYASGNFMYIFLFISLMFHLDVTTTIIWRCHCMSKINIKIQIL